MICHARCTNCGNQKTIRGSFSLGKCEKCDSMNWDVEIGTGGSYPKGWDHSSKIVTILIDGANIAFIFPCAYLALTSSPWWWVGVAWLYAFWFINPRWSKAKGWRFKHADRVKSHE